MVERWSINDLTKKKGFTQTSVRTTGSSRWSSRTPGVSDGLGFSARRNYDSEASELEAERRKKSVADTETGNSKSALDRVASGVGSIGMSLAASVPLLAETAVQTVKDTAAFNDVLHSEAFQQKRQQMRGLIDKMEWMDKSGEEYKAIKAQYDRIAAEMDGMRVNTPLNEDSTGMKLMGKANKMRQQATEGMSGVGAFAADAALSIGQTLAALPTVVLGPAAPIAVLGTQAAAQKAYEVQKEGGGATEALGRGVLSGSIEAATEKIPLDNLWDMVKSGGKGVLRNLLKQAGVEATEEGISYTANYIADKAAGDPNARFSVDELLHSAAAGGLSGLFFGGVGSFAHSQTQSGKPDNIPAQTKTSTALRRGVGRVTGTQEQFAEAYRAKRNPSATDAEVQEQFELFNAYASGQDTASGTMSNQADTGMEKNASPQSRNNRNVQHTNAVDRVTGTREQFAEVYRTKVNHSATNAEIQNQYEQFKAYARGYDVVETVHEPMSRTEIKESLKNLHNEAEIDRVVDGILDRQTTGTAQTFSKTKPAKIIRKPGRAPVGTLKEFRTAYLKKVTDANEVEKQYRRFKNYAKDFDVVETTNGFLTRSEVLNLLSGTKYTAHQINELFDQILDSKIANSEETSLKERAIGQQERDHAKANENIELRTEADQLHVVGSGRKEASIAKRNVTEEDRYSARFRDVVTIIPPFKGDAITHRSLYNNLAKTEIGRETLEYITAEKCVVEISYDDNPPEGERGYTTGFLIVIHARNTKTIKETAKTMVHEVTHAKYKLSGDQHAEVICFAREHIHAYGELTLKDLRSMIKLVKQLYPEYPWRRRR